MKKIVLFSLINFILFSVGNVKGQALTKETLKSKELERHQSMIAADKAALELILHPDLVYHHSSGKADNKQTYIDGIISKRSIYYKIQVEEMQVRLYGNTGIITGIANFIDLKDGQELPPNRLRFTDVWVYEKGQWKMVSWQSTKSPKE